MDINTELQYLSENFQTLSINSTINMAEEQQRRELVLQNIKLIEAFDGDSSYLALYIDSIDSIIPPVLPSLPEQRAFYFNSVLRTLRGPALDVVRREQPVDWATLRQLLIDEFGYHWTPVLGRKTCH
uniref:Uncharacterized protein n=1 Tax=Bactrocera latifrons TaxID=174628 RepID=A0A0K8U7W0_BACLA